VKAWFPTTLRGVCMGIADIIPGVSGGTLALILGIYQRFVGAVSAIGPGLLLAALKGSFWSRLREGLTSPEVLGDTEEDAYVGHTLFLLFLGAGIGTALLIGARVLPTLLNLYPAPMNGFFFGLVLASVVIPFRQMKQRGAKQALTFLLVLMGTWTIMGAPIAQSGKARGDLSVALSEPSSEDTRLSATGVVFMTDMNGGVNVKREVAFGPAADIIIPAGETVATVPVVARMTGEIANLAKDQLKIIHGGPEGLQLKQTSPMTGGEDPALWYIFVAGLVAISAMVLPGISGSFILLMLGLYHFMTFTLRSLVYDRDPDALGVTLVFMAALVIGITGFSRVLRVLLERHQDLTMAALVGMMLASLRKIWPFVETSMAGVESNVLPASLEAQVVLSIVTCMLGIGAVIGLERAGRTALEGD
jgi:uncharacterized membrane protein